MERRTMAKAQIIRYTYRPGGGEPYSGAPNWNQSQDVLVIPGDQGTIFALVRYPLVTTVCRSKNDNKFNLSPLPGDHEMNVLCGEQEIIDHVEIPDEDVALLHAKIDILEHLQPAEERVLQVLKKHQYTGAMPSRA